MRQGKDIQGFSAHQLREARKGSGITLKQLSDGTGIAVSTLSKIENNKARLTVDTAVAIAGVLGLPAATLLSPTSASPSKGRSVVRRSTGIIHQTPGLVMEVLSRDFSNSSSLQWRCIVQARSLEEAGGFRAHSGDEFIYVLSGTLTILFEGDANETLYQGDSISFDGGLPHAYRSEGFEYAVVLMSNGVVQDKKS